MIKSVTEKKPYRSLFDWDHLLRCGVFGRSNFGAGSMIATLKRHKQSIPKNGLYRAPTSGREKKHLLDVAPTQSQGLFQIKDNIRVLSR
jgi:hypothetical protein